MDEPTADPLAPTAPELERAAIAEQAELDRALAEHLRARVVELRARLDQALAEVATLSAEAGEAP